MDSGEIMVALLVVLGFFWMDVGGSDCTRGSGEPTPISLIRLFRFLCTIGDLNFTGDRIEYLALNALNIKVSNAQLP